MNDRNQNACYLKLAKAQTLLEEAAKLLAEATYDAPPSLEGKLESLFQDVTSSWNRAGDLIRE